MQQDHSNHQPKNDSFKREAKVTAGDCGLKVEVDGHEYYASDFHGLIRIMDNIVVCAGGGSYDVRVPMEINVVRPDSITKVGAAVEKHIVLMGGQPS